MDQGKTFSELMVTLMTEQVPVTIGSGENELEGIVVAFDRNFHVVTYQDGESGMLHFIPLTSIRSFGVEDGADGMSCYLDLFRK